MNKMTFANRLTSLRESAGLSIPALAAKAKMPRQTLHLLESGQRQPSLATATKLVKAIGVSLAEFDGVS